ncbi:acid protease [Wolfiporia cocos MD-104 SS10]|uniref:Acid protease n=1 Tax=Wolfiporia cocos (strain MD-104) TaxID=742152 RepID=A0A2H3JH78_WOLCO|nr:acid protease [Wolfiporia cocos MD-104 SS10]
MRARALSLWLMLSAASVSSAVKIPVTRHKLPSTNAHLRRRGGRTGFTRPVVDAASGSSSGDALDLTTVHDLLYIANVTIGGIEYPVQVDTGSSDLWVKGSSHPIPNVKQETSITYNMTYGIGWAYGNVSYADVEFAGIEVANQAFMDVSSASNPALSYGADGIIGLGFDSLSTIDALVNHSGADTGRTFLYNAFAQDKSEPNFISFTLQDDADQYDTVQGYFSIGEYEPQYTDVKNSPKISTWPEAYPIRWTVLLEALLVGSKAVSVSTTVNGAPSNRAVVDLDSGTSYTYAPTEICNAIYGDVEGAEYHADMGMWVVPCSAEVDIALQFDGTVYPINPLDVTPVNIDNKSQCIGTFIPQSVSVGGGEFDWLIGDNVLRSMYAVYDFGDYDSSGNRGNPYVQLLSLVDPDKASVAFHSIRGGQPSNITYNAANVSSEAAGSTTVTLSDELSHSLKSVGDYLPAILALVAFNTIVMLGLVGAGAVYFLRRRGKGKARARKTPGRLSPMPAANTMSTYPLIAGGGEYQPVSMALTDDGFTPPSPAFARPGHSGDLSTARAGDAAAERPVSLADRPMSVA